jgi:pimeloyl-ACP methyl ester carboxylesterase
LTTTAFLDVPGARLRYEIRGNGPLLLLLGSPMDAAAFAPLADVLAGDYTVLTQDPRGVAGSTIADLEQDSTPELRAADVLAILDAVGAETADVFGSSGGAVTGLALVQRWPERVRTLVAHEPPLLDLLPDAAVRRAEVDDMIETFRREGSNAAWYKFMVSAGFDLTSGGDEAPQPPAASAEQEAASARFFRHELRGTTRFLPDIPRLTAGPARVVVGIGADSGALTTYPTSVALADLLGSSPLTFPGDHAGFLAEPAAFAQVLRQALAPSMSAAAMSTAGDLDR